MSIWEEVFSGCTVPPDSKETKFRGSNQEASPSADKNNAVVLVPCSHMALQLFFKCVPTAIFDGVDVSEVLGCHLL